MGVGLTYGSKQLIEIDRNSTPVQPMRELAYFKNQSVFNISSILSKFNFLYNGETLDL